MNSAIEIVFSSRTYFAYFLGKVAYILGWPWDPSELVMTQDCFISSLMSFAAMLNDTTEVPRSDSRMMRSAASSGSRFHSRAKNGRAEWRERVWQYVEILEVGAVVKQKNKKNKNQQ